MNESKYCPAGKIECGRCYGLDDKGMPKCEWMRLDGDILEIFAFDYCPWPSRQLPIAPACPDKCEFQNEDDCDRDDGNWVHDPDMEDQ